MKMRGNLISKYPANHWLGSFSKLSKWVEWGKTSPVLITFPEEKTFLFRGLGERIFPSPFEALRRACFPFCQSKKLRPKISFPSLTRNVFYPSIFLWGAHACAFICLAAPACTWRLTKEMGLLLCRRRRRIRNLLTTLSPIEFKIYVQNNAG